MTLNIQSVLYIADESLLHFWVSSSSILGGDNLDVCLSDCGAVDTAHRTVRTVPRVAE